MGGAVDDPAGWVLAGDSELVLVGPAPRAEASAIGMHFQHTAEGVNAKPVRSSGDVAADDGSGAEVEDAMERGSHGSGLGGGGGVGAAGGGDGIGAVGAGQVSVLPVDCQGKQAPTIGAGGGADLALLALAAVRAEGFAIVGDGEAGVAAGPSKGSLDQAAS